MATIYKVKVTLKTEGAGRRGGETLIAYFLDESEAWDYRGCAIARRDVERVSGPDFNAYAVSDTADSAIDILNNWAGTIMEATT